MNFAAYVLILSFLFLVLWCRTKTKEVPEVSEYIQFIISLCIEITISNESNAIERVKFSAVLFFSKSRQQKWPT